jgi:tRNA threonylcarbamoyladenosine dehydratase
VVNAFIKGEFTKELIASEQYDYAVDCIDTLSPKVFFIKHCRDLGIPMVSSMGAGGKVDPTQVKITDISRTYNCKLAYYVRKKLHQLGIYEGLKVVFSAERAAQKRIIVVDTGPKKSVIGTLSYMPAVFGCVIASVVIRDLYTFEQK